MNVWLESRCSHARLATSERATAGPPLRIFGAHATHLRRCDLRSSLTHLSMRAVRCSAAPSSWTTWTPNLSPRSRAVTPRRVLITGVSNPLGAEVARRLAPQVPYLFG